MRDGSSALRWPLDVIAILSALAALLVYSQYTTLFKFAVLMPSHRYGSLGTFIRDVERQVPLDMTDAIVACLIFTAFVSIFVLELWKKRLSTFLNKVIETEKRTLLALFLICLFCVRFYFARGGLPWAGDANFHIGYAWIASQAFSMGEIPKWTNYFGTGGPYCQFYGFLFFYLTGAVSLLFSDLEFSLKLMMGASHVFSGIGMYLLVRTLLNRQAGFIAALAYVMCVWHTQQVLMMGRYPLSVFYAVLPFPFYFFESLMVRSRRFPYAMGGGLTLGLLAFTHPGYAFWATGFFVLYVCIRIGIDRDRRAIRETVCRHSLLLLSGGLVIGAYLTLPMWLERENVGLDSGVNLSGLPDPTLGQLFIWSNYRFRLFQIDANHWYGGYLGLSLIGLSLVGLTGTLLFSNRRPGTHAPAFEKREGFKMTLAADLPSKSWPAAVCLILSLVLVFAYRWPPLASLGIVQAFNAGRYLLFVVFFLSVLAGVGSVALVHFCQIRRSGIDIFTILLITLFADLGPTTFQQPYFPQSGLKEPYLIGTEAAQLLQSEASQFPEGEIPNLRNYYATDTDYRPFSISFLAIKTGLVTFLGSFNEAPLATKTFCHPLEDSLNSAIREAEKLESPAAQDFGPINDGLYLLNAKRFIARHSKKEELMIWTLPAVSPVVVSSTVKGWDLPVNSRADAQAQSTLMQLVKEIGVNQDENTCDRILLAGYKGTEDLGTSPSVQVLEHRTWNQRVELFIRTSSPCFARLAYAYYPYLSVTINGEKVVPYQTAGRFIAVRLSEGEHRIVLEPVLSPLRRGLLILNIALAAVCIGYFGWRARFSLVWSSRQR